MGQSVIIFFYIWCFFTAAAAIVADRKGLNVLLGIVLGIFLGPLALLILLLLSPNKPTEQISTETSPENLRQELENIKDRLRALNLRVAQFEDKLLPQVKTTAAMPVKNPEPSKPPPLISASGTDLETDIGRLWLNKVGITVFALGIAFLITYTFKYFGPLAKILFGYLVSAGLFYFGLRWEKDKALKNYGYVLLGGAWAIAYFITYAMYHFAASRIISSGLLDMMLLCFVAAGIIAHSLKYKAQGIFAVSIFVGYVTATLGEVGYFTFAVCALLALITLIVVWRMNWPRMIILGIVLTYGVHYFWVLNHISMNFADTGSRAYFALNSLFLTVYWLLFTGGTHLLARNGTQGKASLGAANFANALLFFMLEYSRLAELFPDQKFIFVFALGAFYLILAMIMDRKKQNELFLSDIVTAVYLLTMSLYIKLAPFDALAAWLIEIPFLLFVGLRYDRKVYRYLSLVLAGFVFFKWAIFNYAAGREVFMLGTMVEWDKFIAALGFISSFACFLFDRRKNFPQNFYAFYSALACFYLVMYPLNSENHYVITFVRGVEAFAVFMAGCFLSDRYLRAYGFFIITWAAMRALCLYDQRTGEKLLRTLAVSAVTFFHYAGYAGYRYLEKKNQTGQFDLAIKNILFAVGGLLLTVLLFREVSERFISLAFGLAGVVLFALGFVLKDKKFRWAGFVAFAITIGRIVLYDISGLEMIYKIISFIALGLLFLSVSFVYTKYVMPKDKE